MTTPKFLSGCNGLKIFIFLVLAASSLFAYVLPKSIKIIAENTVIKEDIVFLAHPLSGISDNVVICSNDGSEVHEIYLCGASDERLLTTSISNYKQIFWSKLQDSSCSASQPNCPNTSPTCNWSQVSTNTQHTVTGSGEYRIYVQYNDNSIERYYFNVYANGQNPSAVVTDIDCNGPGSITINNVPSTYEYSINSGATWQDSNVFSITSANSYNVQLRRKNNTDGCLFEVNDILVNNNSIDATATMIPITCGDAKGGIKIDINDASTTYIYEISQGGSLVNSSGPVSSSTYTFNNLDAGTYDIEIRFSNSLSCTWTATQTLAPFDTVQPSAVVTKNIDCTEGIISVTQTGGSAPYEYSINGSAIYTPFASGNQTTIPVTTAGNYTFSVRDTNGCEIDSAPVNVIDEPEIVYTIISKDITCNGANDGSLKVDVTNTQGYTLAYSVNGGSFQSSGVFSNLNSGIYTITIRKTKPGSTCTVTAAPVTIVEPASLTATAAVTTPIDCDNTTATIGVTGTAGGTAPYKYSLNGTTFQTNTTFSGLGFGDYTVTIADQNNCKVTIPLTVDASAHPSNLLFAIDNVNCTTKATDIAVTVENGTGPFTYRIVSPIPTTPSANNVFTGLIPNLVYKFEVVTAENCKIVRDYAVPQPMQFSTFATVKNNVSCSTAADGVIEVAVNDFQTSYNVVIEDSFGAITTFGVSNVTTSPITISNLPADTYTIKIADESGPCPKIQTATVKKPAAPLTIASHNVVHVLCGKPGSVTINATGGWGSYKYQVRRPDNTLFPVTAQTNKTITGLTQFGLYTILVTDINGCVEDTQTFTIEDRQGPVAQVDQTTSEYCYTTATKSSLKIDILSGYPPYVYTLNNGPKVTITGTSFTLTNLTPKKYVVKIIDANLCSAIVADTEIKPQLFAIGTLTKPLGCGSAPADRATITGKANGGYGVSTFEVRRDGGAWSSVSLPFPTAIVGSYELRATDQKGCTAISQPINVVIPPTIGSDNKITPTACGSNQNGSIVVKGTGGTPPFQYSFDGSPFTSKTLYNKLDATDYILRIRDKLNCEFTETVTIGALPSISAVATKITDISCNAGTGDNPGSIEISNVQDAVGLVRIRLNGGPGNTSGTPPWVYQNVGGIDMSNPATIHTININQHGTYHVTVEDERGCIWKSDPITITRPPIPHGVTQPVGMQTCANGATFDFTVTPDPGLVGPFKMRMWPGSPDDPFGGAWRDFDAATNPSYDALDPNNERDYRVSGLLFGIDYDIIVLDMNTQCTYVADLGMVIAPDPPDDKFKAFSTIQSYTCAASDNGVARIRVEAAGDANTFGAGGPDGIQSVTWKTYNASGSSDPTYVHTGTANDSGSGGDVIFDIPNMISGWYVVEVQNESGCTIGHRFNIYAPPVQLKNYLQDYSPPNCNIGAQIAVEAKGGWNDQSSYQSSNTIDPTWREYEYAYVLSNISDPITIPASEWTTEDYIEITPTAYDGVNNVYQVWVRDAAGCMDELDTPITIIKDIDPQIDSVVVNNTCSAPDELYSTTINITGGTGTIYYIWDGDVTTTNTKDLSPGEHTVQVNDQNGCITLSQDLLIYPQMQTSASVTQIEPCNPINSGEVLVEVYGGSGDYTIEQISPAGPTNTTGIFTGLTHSISYQFRIHDNLSGCADQTVTAYIDEPLIPKFRTVTPVQQVTCNGDDNGKIIVEPEPGQTNLDVLYDYSINGAPYQASNIFDKLAPGTYTITVHSEKNCIQTLPDVIITQPTPLVLDTPTFTPFACTPDNSYGTGILSVTVNSTGTAPYNFSYNGSGFSTADTFEFLYTSSPQTYVIDVVDKNGCTDQTTIIIPAAEKVEASVNEIQAMNCDQDAIIEIVGTPAAVNPTDYEVRELISGNLINGTGQGQITISAGNPGYYIYELLDTTTGCASIVTYSIAPFDFIAVSATKLEDVHCFGDAYGALEFAITGYSGAFDYEIIDTSNSGTPFITSSGNTTSPATLVNTLPVGTYYVRVKATDIPLCEAESNHITIQSPEAALDFTYEITNLLTCSPGSDAEITATPFDGWSGYEFELVDPANPGTPIQSFDPNNVLSGLTSGINYELTLRDSGGCDNVMKVITIPTIDDIITSVTSTNPTCPGAINGSITVTATREFGNGHTNFQYILNNIDDGVSGTPQSSNIFSNLLAGHYSVMVIDGRGCDVIAASIDLIDPTVVVVNAAITQEPSCTPDQGEITLSATGGSGSFEYRMISPITSAWTTNNVFGSLASDTYEFLARDADPLNLCESPISVIRTINVVEPLEVTVDETNTIINCSSEMDAVLIAEAIGGLGDYTFELQDGSGSVKVPAQSSGIFENLGAGTYRIMALSGIDCVAISDNISIIEPPLLSATLTDQRNVQCFGQADGNATITVTGGVAPYSYTLSSEPQKTLDTNFFENLDVGSYSVIVQDANGCDIEVPIVINGPTEALAITISRVEDELCSSDDNGLIELQITGGTAPYMYSLQDSSGSYSSVIDPSALVIDNLDGGAYIVYVRDSNSCTENVLQEIEVGADLTATYETIYECRDGQPVNITTVTVEDDSITNDVMYALDSEDVNSAQDSPLFENIAPGTHYISILHSGGCIERLDNIVIDTANPLVLTSQQGGINEIKVEATGGDGSYTYYFDNHSSQEGSYFINHTATYVVRVVDSKGCETSIDVYLEFIDIEIPNFFTPDGDGIRDTWVIGNSGGFPNMLVTIFDRYGRQIKQYIGVGEWDGMYKKEDLPTGDYWYVIKLNGPNDDREFVGHMTVYR